MEKQWKRILELVRRTHERCVILSEETGDAYVLLPFGEYETLTMKPEARERLEEKDEIVLKEAPVVSPLPVAATSESTLTVSPIGETVPQKNDALFTEEERFYLEPLE